MKREDILAMPAGRELDALIASKVIGFRKGHGATWITGRSKTGGLLQTHQLRFYTTDISAAWEVVEKLCENEDVKFGIDRNYSIKNMWVAGFNYNHGSYAGHTATTAPEAICKAALLTVLEGQTHEA